MKDMGIDMRWIINRDILVEKGLKIGEFPDNIRWNDRTADHLFL